MYMIFTLLSPLACQYIRIVSKVPTDYKVRLERICPDKKYNTNRLYEERKGFNLPIDRCEGNQGAGEFIITAFDILEDFDFYCHLNPIYSSSLKEFKSQHLGKWYS